MIEKGLGVGVCRCTRTRSVRRICGESGGVMADPPLAASPLTTAPGRAVPPRPACSGLTWLDFWERRTSDLVTNATRGVLPSTL